MPITIGFFSWEWINHFHFISYGKNLFGIRPVWYKSEDLERIKDGYRGTTVYVFIFVMIVLDMIKSFIRDAALDCRFLVMIDYFTSFHFC
jgi:hypothetical protein